MASCVSTENEARTGGAGMRDMGDLSRELREGSEVKVVDWVSRECTETELLCSLCSDMVYSAVDMSRRAGRGIRKRSGSSMPLSFAARVSRESTRSSVSPSCSRRASAK